VNGELMDGGSTQQVANNMSLLERLMQ